MAQFRLTKSEHGQFHFSLVNEEDKTLVQSEMYNSKSSALNGIESVRSNAAEVTHYDYRTSKDGQFYFNLTARNGQVVATSRMHDTEQACQAVAEAVKQQAPQAKVIEA